MSNTKVIKSGAEDQVMVCGHVIIIYKGISKYVYDRINKFEELIEL